MRIGRATVIGAVVVSLMAAGCGKGSASGSSSSGGGKPAVALAPAATASTVPLDDFCSGLDDLNNAAQQVGLDKRLAAVRSDLEGSATKASDVLAGGLPGRPGVEPFLSRLVSDLHTISGWLDTKATQSDLDADRVPSQVRKSIDDMGFDFRQLQQWAEANCKDQQQGDDH